MGKMSRDKGKRAELEIVHILNDTYGYNVRRGDCFRHQADVINLCSIHIEVKACDKLELTTWLNQAVIAADRYKDGLPVVFFRQVSRTSRGKEWLALMRHEDWTAMNGETYGTTVEDKRKSFKGGIYTAMAEANANALRFRRPGLDMVCMTLEDWIDMYGYWKLPFTEG